MAIICTELGHSKCIKNIILCLSVSKLHSLFLCIPLTPPSIWSALLPPTHFRPSCSLGLRPFTHHLFLSLPSHTFRGQPPQGHHQSLFVGTNTQHCPEHHYALRDGEADDTRGEGGGGLLPLCNFPFSPFSHLRVIF